MIRTVTLNTGFDEVFAVSGITFGGVEEVLRHTELAAGKGVNAARTVRALGHGAVAYALIGADDEALFRAALLAEGIAPVLVAVPGRTRRNLTLLPAGAGRPAAHFRAPGFDLDGGAAPARLAELLAAEVRPGDVVTISGSSPLGAGPDVWTALAEVAVRAGADLVVDVYGPELSSLLRRVGDRVLACKPNAREIEDLRHVGRDSHGALRFLAGCGVRLPVVTLGADGVLFAFEDGVWAARCPVREARVPVGAGDAFAGALAAGVATGLRPGPELVRFATAVASAHVESVPADRLRDELPGFTWRATVERLGDL